MTDHVGEASFAGSGGLASSGRLVVQGGASLAGTGALAADWFRFTGTAAASLPRPFTSVFTGQNIVIVDARLPAPLTSTITAVMGTKATVVASLPSPFTSSFRHGASITLTLPRLRGTIAGFPAVVGAVVSPLPPLRGALAGTVTTIGTVNGGLYSLRGVLSGYAGRTGRIVGSIRSLRGVFTGGAGATGGVAASLPTLVAELAGYTSTYGTTVVNLPRPFTMRATNAVTWTYQTTYVTNTTTFAPTVYADYGFNSFAEVNGRFLAAKADGIYAVNEGDLDQTTPISAEFATGALDFGIRELKRPENIYATYSTDGPLKVSVTADKGTTYSYRMNESKGEFAQRRVAIGKGQRGKHWKIAVSNYEGEYFSFSSLDAVFAQTARRI